MTKSKKPPRKQAPRPRVVGSCHSIGKEKSDATPGRDRERSISGSSNGSPTPLSMRGPSTPTPPTPPGNRSTSGAGVVAAGVFLSSPPNQLPPAAFPAHPQPQQPPPPSLSQSNGGTAAGSSSISSSPSLGARRSGPQDGISPTAGSRPFPPSALSNVGGNTTDAGSVSRVAPTPPLPALHSVESTGAMDSTPTHPRPTPTASTLSVHAKAWYPPGHSNNSTPSLPMNDLTFPASPMQLPDSQQPAANGQSPHVQGVSPMQPAGRGASHSTVNYSQSPMQGTNGSQSPDAAGRGYGFKAGSSELPPPAYTPSGAARRQDEVTPSRPQQLTDRGYFYDDDDDDVTCQYITVTDEMFHDERAMFRHMMEEGRNLQAARNHHMLTQSSSPTQHQQPPPQQLPPKQQQELPSPQQNSQSRLASPPSSVSGALSNGATTPVFTDHGGEPAGVGEAGGEGEGEGEEEEYYEEYEYEEEEFEETDGSDLDWIEEQLENHRKQHQDDPTLFWG